MTKIIGWRYELLGQLGDWHTKLQFDEPDPDNWQDGHELRNIEPLVEGTDDPVAWYAEYYSRALGEWKEKLFKADVTDSEFTRNVKPLEVKNA